MNEEKPLTIGQYLRQERERKNISLAEVARVTRITLLSLEALERDEFHPFSPGGSSAPMRLIWAWTPRMSWPGLRPKRRLPFPNLRN
ncbi:MAG: helix-turn-helix domain-containing protein [Deltaproteobacteria bacterium]|nr:helix-turn-helix domain-containing protein [Deltaproteobacteria bacterium]